MKKGFTLIELSIVLVIIGLLIGGILVGQSLIESAKINAQIKQLQQYDIAVQNFKQKFNYLPGDTPTHPLYSGSVRATAVAGDNRITGCNAGTGSYECELGAFWYHLSLNGLYGDYQAHTDADVFPTIGVHMPKAEIDSNLGIVGATITNGPYSDINTYLIGLVIDGSSGFDIAPGIHPVTVLSIDTKIDDSIANTGDILATGGASSSALIAGATNTAGSGCVENSNASVYQINSTNGAACSFVVRMGSFVSENFNP